MLRQEDLQFEQGLGDFANTCLKMKNKKGLGM